MSQDERLEELGRFLKDRRGRIRPADVGLPPTTRRRVRGLRREEVASLAGIGVSWYTALENGTAPNVSDTTLQAVADVLRLSDSERHYAFALADDVGDRFEAVPGPLLIETMHALTFPAYVIDAGWNALACNAAFRRVWAIDEREVPFNAIERLFIDPTARAMHGARFFDNISPVLAMLRSGLGRRPNLENLRRLRDRLLADDAVRAIWDGYEISSPFTTVHCTIDSAIGPFSYRTLDLPIARATHGLVVHVPDAPSHARLESAIRQFS